MSRHTDKTQHSRSGLRRSRRRKKRKPKKLEGWLGNYGLEILLLLLFVVAAIPLFNFWSLFTAVSTLIENSPARWLVQDKNSQVLGGVLMLLTTLAAGWRLRWRILNHVNWFNRRCPNCQEPNLKRIHRTWVHRLTGLTSIPVRRYICHNCRWRGLRIDESKTY